jgi:LmbE family N-acetylglucosaminyl deacetylase
MPNVIVGQKACWFASGAFAALAAVALWNDRSAHSQPTATQPPTATLVPSTLWRPTPAQKPADGKLRVIAFGAHPDDCELRAAGCAAKWAAAGHKVKFVSCTNGDIGHWGMAGGPLAQRRRAEVAEAARILGIATEVLDIHDGELVPDLETRRKITRLIREWKADLVLSHRPNDYHPDHRNVGVVVQDAAFMVVVPHFCPDTPFLETNPVFLYYEDRFLKPTPFKPDVVVAIDDVIEKKFAVTEALHSQFFEGGAIGNPRLPPDPGQPDAVAARKREVREGFAKRFHATASRFGLELAEWYGDKAAAVRYAEAFEVCEYGRMPTKAELRKLFPFEP